ncbi:MAG: hypothetical protein ACPGYX_09045 [Oceanobacter sp.]
MGSPIAEQSQQDPLLDFNLPSPGYLGDAPLSLWASYYYSWSAKTDSDGLALLGSKNQRLGTPLRVEDWCHASTEGRVSLKTEEGWETYEVLDTRGPRQMDCGELTGRESASADVRTRAHPRTRFNPVDGPFGNGVRGYQLVPFRTLAVDVNRIRYGSLLFFPALVGAEIHLPDGRMLHHDGYFFAADTEREIRGSHVRIFQGLQSENAFPDFVQNRSDHRLQAWVIKDPELGDRIRSLHSSSAESDSKSR